MKKHMKIRAEFNPFNDMVEVEVLGMLSGENFGGNSGVSTENHLFFGTDACLIARLHDGAIGWLGLNSKDTLADIELEKYAVFTLTPTQYKIFKQAVKEYNEWGRKAMKHYLCVKGELLMSAKLYKVKVTVLEQSHIRAGFGEGLSESFTASNRIRLGSYDCPSRYAGDKYSIYLRGRLKEYDLQSFTLTLAHWKKLKQAVKEYNEWGEKQ